MEYAIKYGDSEERHFVDIPFPTFGDAASVLDVHGGTDNLRELKIRDNVGRWIIVVDRDKDDKLVWHYTNLPGF